MIEDRVSSTALGDAFIRAAYVQWCNGTLIDDPVSRRLLTDEEFEAFTASVLKSARNQGVEPHDVARAAGHWLAFLSAAAPHVVLRTRFVREQLSTALRSGEPITRYVILAAGLDTFAVHPTAESQAVSVVEIDLPATQRLKLERLKRAGLTSRATHRAGDLSDGSLTFADGERHGPAMVSLAGVSYYLSEAAIEHTLNAVRLAFGSGTTVVADYWDARHAGPAAQDRATSSMFASVARNGEQFRTCLAPVDWQKLSERAGFTVEVDRSAPEYLASTGKHAATMLARPIGRFTLMRAR